MAMAAELRIGISSHPWTLDQRIRSLRLRPVTPIAIRTIEKIFKAFAGSLKYKIPMMLTITIPDPTHTA